MSVTRIDEFTNRDVIDAMRELLRLAQHGGMRAFVISFKTGPRVHQIGIAGDYWDNPAEALTPLSRMEYKVNQLVSARGGEPETGFGGL